MSKNTTPLEVAALLSLPLADEGTFCPPGCAVALPVLCVPELVPAIPAGRKGIN